MVAPRWVARFNRIGTNRLLGPLAPWLPGFGIITHQGRRSGRQFRTPVSIFRRPGGFVIALTYGSGSDWVRNVLAQGGCTLQTQRRTCALTRPRLVRDRRGNPIRNPLIRAFLGRLKVDEFLELDVDERTGWR